MGARKKRWIVTYEIPIMVYVEATTEEKAETAADAIYYDHDGQPGVWTGINTLLSAIGNSVGREDRSVTLGITYDDVSIAEQT